MKYTRDDYKRFLNTELETQLKEYEQLVNTKAIVLKERGEVFVGIFLKLNSSGIAIFKVRNFDNMPRKNSFWTAVYLNGEMGKFKNWGDESWSKLRQNYQSSYSDSFCAWISKSEEPDFCLIGIKNLTIEFADLLEEGKTIIAFGPKDPPLQYLLNLVSVVNDSRFQKTNHILDYNEKESQWNPVKVDANTDLSNLLIEQMNSVDCIAVQGPPGTGKTYRMAQLAALLLKKNKSVLVTALTNQALMELAKKDDIKPFLDGGKVSKTSLTVDESKDLPKLLPNRDNLCDASNGHLSLASFYLSSGWAKNATDIPFDFVIMDEASQALFPMIAATMKLGKKIIWIGDQNQLAPIVLTNEDVINRFNWSAIVNGFETISHNFTYHSYMLSDTFRLTQRGAECTGVFYDNNLRSVSKNQNVPTKLEWLHKEGGPVLKFMNLKIGDKIPSDAFDVIIQFVKDILSENPNANIAILSKFRESVRQLQKSFVLNWSTNEIPENIKIETVDRVQGLTVDYCIFFIPNASIRYSLEKALFNVATSRARFNTIIVSDYLLLRENMSEEVRKYILKAQEDKFVAFESPSSKSITAGNIEVKVVDKIDLSKFERNRTEIVKGKENIYIVDTNVFVTCPDIISKIGKQYKILIPTKVLEELDKLKLNNDVDKKSLNNAAKNINSAFINNFSKMEEADVSLLPFGFDKKNPDCMILSVALKYKHENPILLTSDNMLQTRANGLGITTISLKDFLKR